MSSSYETNNIKNKMIIAGLILKLNQQLSDLEIIELLKLNDKVEKEVNHMNFDDLTSDEFNGLGIIRFPNGNILVIHRNLGYTCSFEGTTMYGLDLRLQSLSQAGEVLCFLSNPYSNTFAYAYFKDGLRKANQAIADGEVLEGKTSLE